MQEKIPYTFQSDVYAFGVVLYELQTGQLPYMHAAGYSKDQILFMVGKGYLRPEMGAIRSDMPKQFVRLTSECIKFIRDERPVFQNILAKMDVILKTLPKIRRSKSEPCLTKNRFGHSADDLDEYSCASPKTPSHYSNLGHFGKDEPFKLHTLHYNKTEDFFSIF